ncbi:hypothetical protein OEZ85_012092 [Tetradesmus obliquus]|uniref:EGF-like domain-containing protein n=1 Tax=Tetradesmus obliquus TaxID=3088 RepID=A0ABY8TSA4_TETOB|nr:hypothetical protein OEZ85_012092 [Tetradesmus obliquus]
MAHRTVAILALALCVSIAAAQQGDQAVAAGNCVPGCKNRGVCTAIEGLADEFFCKCPPGYMGADCTAMYQECTKGLVCYNGGKCTAGDSPDTETCACPAKWTGATCKVPVETCTNKTANPLSCMNGGTCMLDTAVNEHYCKCPPNVRGRHCQFGVKECKDGMYCMNDGSCTSDGLSCSCPSGFFGLHCQNNMRDPNADRIAKPVPKWAIALAVVGSVLLVAGAGFIGFLIHREKKGSPYFRQWQNDVQGVSHI